MLKLVRGRGGGREGLSTYYDFRLAWLG
jgi:hypothetical protein